MRCTCCGADDGQKGDRCDACAEGERCPECRGCENCCECANDDFDPLDDFDDC